MKYGLPTNPRAIAWLQLATSRTAHGGDLEIPGTPSPYDVDQHLLDWEQEGWILRGVFDPDLSQRALSIVHPSNRATMAEAKKVLESAQAMKIDLYQTSYWWLRGPKAHEIEAQLLPRPIQTQERVRYRRGYLRSIGMLGDDEMLRWRGAVVGRLSEMSKILECVSLRGSRPVRVHEGNVERERET